MTDGLQIAWFWLVGVLLTGYVILDGFDLGVGFWYLFARKESDRRALLTSILPYWDGNEVWLLTGGGAVFAAFPAVYATIFSGLYLALMLVLFALILRAVSIEFRLKAESAGERRLWDAGFAIGSILPALLFGVAAGNILSGLPLDASGNHVGTFLTLLNPYSMLVGVTGLALFATHGALFAALKTDGEIATRARGWAQRAWVVYLALFVASAVATAVQPAIIANYKASPALWTLPALALICILAVGYCNHRRLVLKGFIASSLGIVAIFAALGGALFPRLVPASNDPALSLTISNSSSSPLTLKTMLILAAVGVPIVLAYTVWVHMIFRGKTSIVESY